MIVIFILLGKYSGVKVIIIFIPYSIYLEEYIWYFFNLFLSIYFYIFRKSSYLKFLQFYWNYYSKVTNIL